MSRAKFFLELVGFRVRWYVCKNKVFADLKSDESNAFGWTRPDRMILAVWFVALLDLERC
jgi:hypothetical protein